MRVLALAGLVVAALGVALWLLIVREDHSNVVPDATASTTSKKTDAAPTASAPAGMPARKVDNVGAELRKSIGAQRDKNDRAAPALAPEGSGSGSAKIPTAEDHQRWAMMRAVHSIEPAVIDCLNDAKNKGETFGDAIASYSFTFSKKGEEIVLDGSTLEYGPFSDAVNSCIQSAGKTMEAAIEGMPPGATRIKLINKITLQQGEIRNVQMPGFHILETQP